MNASVNSAAITVHDLKRFETRLFAKMDNLSREIRDEITALNSQLANLDFTLSDLSTKLDELNHTMRSRT